MVGHHLALDIRGASHASAIRFSLAGFPKGFRVDETAFAAFMERRAPGRDKLSTPRREPDRVVFQAFNLLETLNVRENIALSVRLDHGRVNPARVTELVEKLGLDGKERRRPSELSGGEQQRVAIARALFAKPDIVLADEPTGNLDARSSQAICDILRDLNRTEKSAILLITHDPVVAAAATRVCFLRDGRLADDFPTNHDATAISQRYLASFA